MGTYIVDVYLLWKDEPWAGKAVKLHYKPRRFLDFGSSYSKVEVTDNEGHATFEIDDCEDTADGKIDEDTPIIITVQNHGNFDFGPYTLGGSGYTINMDPDTEQEQISF